MNGIAGIIHLTASAPLPEGALARMSAALAHRGPAGETRLEAPGLGLVARRLGTWAIEEQNRPASNHEGNISALLAGEIYEQGRLYSDLAARGHRLSGANPAELLPHLWEEHGEAMFARLHGQFAAALWDARQRRLILCRDRFGIAPLHWCRVGDWLVFASEIKALLASGLIDARPDRRGIAQVFTFFGLPGPITCFEGVSALVPGHWLDVRPGTGAAGSVVERTYWEMDFPDRGQEDRQTREDALVDRYEALLSQAVARRLEAGVPVAAYSSGGLDSSMIVSLARRLRGTPLETFTFQIEHPTLRESSGAEVLGRHLGAQPHLVTCRPADIIGTFPDLVRAAESPVIDASAAALFRLADAVHAAGRKVVLTGEGADEWQAGYPWFRIDKKLGFLDLVPGLELSRRAFLAWLRFFFEPRYTREEIERAETAAAGHNAWLTVYHLMSVAKIRFFSAEMKAALGDYLPLDDLGLNRERMRRWHPLNRSIYMGGRVHLMGLHLAARGDRSTMRSSVQGRYPFLDNDLVDFLAGLEPRWKMRGLQDKYLQRRLADRLLPAELFQGRKRLLHAPFDAFHEATPPPLVERLLSDAALRQAGYFDSAAVAQWRRAVHRLPRGYRRLFVEMGLVGVVSTQLWHHAFIDPSLADAPARSPAGAIAP